MPSTSPSVQSENADYTASPSLEHRPLFTAARQPRSLKRDVCGTRFVPDHAQETQAPLRLTDDRRDRADSVRSATDSPPADGSAPRRGPSKSADS